MTSDKRGIVYLIPSALHEGALETIPSYVVEAVKQCQVFFVENERSARRFLKSVWKDMVIDDYEWFAIHKAEAPLMNAFTQAIGEGKNIGIISEAGCPGVADPGQVLAGAAHAHGAFVKPLVGPSSILLALMASGMNGQRFQFNGYLPIDAAARTRTLKQLEQESAKHNCTQIFIETPYRNNQLFEAMLHTLQPATFVCVAVDLTAASEWIKTMRVADWIKGKPELHKRPAIFLLLAEKK